MFCPIVGGNYRVAANRLFKDLGLQFVSGVVYSDAQVQATVMHIKWAYTNELASHPVAKDVQGIWYPVASEKEVWNANTVPFQTDDSWTVLLSGEHTARVEPVKFEDPRVNEWVPTDLTGLESKPPLLAARTYGKGRIAVCALASAHRMPILPADPGAGRVAAEDGNGGVVLLAAVHPVRKAVVRDDAIELRRWLVLLR